MTVVLSLPGPLVSVDWLAGNLTDASSDRSRPAARGRTP
jgi:hypothetical protein